LDDPPEPEPDYGRLVAQNVLASFKNGSIPSGAEISGLRRVFYIRGWSYLACLRFMTDDRVRTYAFFIQRNQVIESRYAVQSDECGAQQYVPFDLAAGSTWSPGAGRSEPLY
jgi:hypothetical protein